MKQIENIRAMLSLGMSYEKYDMRNTALEKAYQMAINTVRFISQHGDETDVEDFRSWFDGEKERYIDMMRTLDDAPDDEDEEGREPEAKRPRKEEDPRGSGKMLHKLMKGAGMSHLLVPEGGRSAKWGFVHRMLGENKVKNKGSYKPANSLPKGSKMNAPRHFTFSKIKGRPIVSKFIDKWFNNEGRRYLRANKFEDALKGKTTQEIKDMLHELIGNPQNKGKKNTPREYGKTMDEIRANVVRLMREGK